MGQRPVQQDFFFIFVKFVDLQSAAKLKFEKKISKYNKNLGKIKNNAKKPCSSDFLPSYFLCWIQKPEDLISGMPGFTINIFFMTCFYYISFIMVI